MVNQKFPRFLRLGDAAITIQFGLDTTRELNQQVSAFINSLEEEINTGKFSLKEMKTGEQKVLSLEEVVEVLK